MMEKRFGAKQVNKHANSRAMVDRLSVEKSGGSWSESRASRSCWTEHRDHLRRRCRGAHLLRGAP